MRTLRAAAEGLRRGSRAWRVGVLLLGANLFSAAVLAVPLAVMLDQQLHHRAAGVGMMYGFDYPWWSEWSDTRAGWARSLGPDLLGAGFAFKNVDLLARGEIPMRLFTRPGSEPGGWLPDPLIFTAGLAYLLLHVFLTGGVMSVLRQRRPVAPVRAFLHACGFYFGRFLRISLLLLAVAGLLFLAYWPLAGWMDDRAREAVSERAATAWLFGRHVLLLLGLAVVHVTGVYARIVTVTEERRSAVLALLSGAGLFARAPLRALGVAAMIPLLTVVAVALWSAFEHAWVTTGYRTQLVTFAAMQAFMLARILARLAGWSGLFALYEGRAGAVAE